MPKAQLPVDDQLLLPLLLGMVSCIGLPAPGDPAGMRVWQSEVTGDCLLLHCVVVCEYNLVTGYLSVKGRYQKKQP